MKQVCYLEHVYNMLFLVLNSCHFLPYIPYYSTPCMHGYTLSCMKSACMDGFPEITTDIVYSLTHDTVRVNIGCVAYSYYSITVFFFSFLFILVNM